MDLTVEENLKSSEKLTQPQIDQIKEIFIMMDEDKSGALSYDEVAKVLSKLSRNTISKDEAIKIIDKMDANKDGTIEWSEFLQAMYEWLESIGALKELGLTDENNTISDRKNFHLKLANFFLQFNQDKSFVQASELFSQQNENFEDMDDFWNFFLQKQQYNEQEKWQYYNETQGLLENFSTIAQKINSNEYEASLSAVQDCVRLLNIVAVFKTPGERFGIANHIIRIFDLIENSSCLGKVAEFLKGSEDAHIIYECLKFVTIYCNGPRIANTPESSNLHPDKYYHKSLLIKLDVIPNVLKFMRSDCIEVRRQSMLAIGFLCRNCADLRDFIIGLGGAATLIESITQIMEIEDARCVSSALSILAGYTVRSAALPDITLIVEMVKSFTHFLYWKDDINIITTSLMGLSILLPAVELNENNQDLWKRIVVLLTHNSIIVKRAGLNCIRKVILSNDLQGQYFVENGLIVILSELITYNNMQIKSEACGIISVLASKGYAWPILEITSITTNLIMMIYEDSELRQASIKVLKELSCIGGEFNRILLNAGVMKTIFSNLTAYKDYDKTLKEIYDHLELSYRFEYLLDSLKVLNNLIITTTGVSDVGSFVNFVASKLEQESIDKIKNLIESMFQDIEQRKIPIIQLQNDYNNVVAAINDLLSSCIEVYQNAAQSEYIRRCGELLTNLKANFSDLSHKYSQVIENYSLYSNNKKMQVRCFSADNFPNGNNRILDDIPFNTSLLEMCLIIEQSYSLSPIVLQFVDNNNKRVNIEDDNMFSKALEKAFNEQQGKGANSPLILDLIITSPMVKGLKSFILGDNGNQNMFNSGSNMLSVFQNSNRTNLVNKDSLLGELNSKTNLNKAELDQIYNNFVRVTKRRFQNKADGTVNHQEFYEIMSNYVSDQDLMREIFNSLDTDKKGLIDFRDFVCALSILKGGTLEDKLRLAFLAYDVDHNGFIDKDEMLQLLRATAKSRNLLLSQAELYDAVNKVFNVVDKNNDGRMSYTEFKTAVLSNNLLINPFWTNPTFNRGNITVENTNIGNTRIF